MKKEKREKWLDENFVICECGYHNHKEPVNFYGICCKCKKVLNERAYFRYMLKNKIKTRKNGVWINGIHI